MSFLAKRLCTVGVLLLTLPIFSASANQSTDDKQAPVAVSAQPEAVSVLVSAEQETNASEEKTTAVAPAPEPESAPVPESAPEPVAVEESVAKEPTQAPGTAEVVKTDTEVNASEPTPVAAAPLTAPATKQLETSALAPVKFTLNSEEQKRAYASGVTLARYLQENMAQQQKLHITLDPQIVLAGIVDTFKSDIKMDEATIQKTMAVFDEQVNVLNKAKFEQESRRELDIGAAYQADFAKEDGVKKSKTGLLYQIVTKGSGAAIKDTDMVEIELVGTLASGKVFEKTTNPIALKVSDVIPALRSGIKLGGKGGEVKLVVPPEQGYGVKGAQPGIPPNATLIFNIKVLQAGASKSK